MFISFRHGLESCLSSFAGHDGKTKIKTIGVILSTICTRLAERADLYLATHRPPVHPTWLEFQRLDQAKRAPRGISSSFAKCLRDLKRYFNIQLSDENIWIGVHDRHVAELFVSYQGRCIGSVVFFNVNLTESRQDQNDLWLPSSLAILKDETGDASLLTGTELEAFIIERCPQYKETTEIAVQESDSVRNITFLGGQIVSYVDVIEMFQQLLNDKAFRQIVSPDYSFPATRVAEPPEIGVAAG